MSEAMRIAGIGTATGSRIIDNVAQAAAYDRDEDFVHARLGPLDMPEAADEETAVALAKTACDAVMAQTGIAPSEIGLLIFVSQNPDFGGLPHNAAILQGELGLDSSSVCFDVGLGCSGYVYGLSIADAMMHRMGIDSALLVTSDQYRKHLKPGDTNTQLLFGDGAAATLLTRTGDGLRYRDARLGTDGTKHKALIRSAEGIEMSGRAVYAFSRKVVPDEIETFLRHHGLSTADIDQVLLHQGSRAIINEITKALDLSPEKVPVGLYHTGNTVSSSLPFLLKDSLEQTDQRYIVLAGFGVGLSWGVALLER